MAIAAAPAQSARARCDGAARAITFYRAATWDWQSRHDARRAPARHAERSPSCAYKRWAAKRWQKRAWRERQKYERWYDAVHAKWACIISHEGAWTTNTGNGYYGALQMDMSFQRSYGPEFLSRYGTANEWPDWAQLLVAERAFHSGRGYYPWPRTARYCRLI